MTHLETIREASKALENIPMPPAGWEEIDKILIALDALNAERPSVPLEPLRLLYNMAALNGKIPDNRDEIITAHMAEFGFSVKETP